MIPKVEKALSHKDKDAKLGFIRILKVILRSRSEDDLRRDLKELFGVGGGGIAEYFEYGFGHYHLWVHELPTEANLRQSERILLVRF